MPLNFEFKARTTSLPRLEDRLKKMQPDYKGEDHQTDTYFNVQHGRLKLREGNIENALIHYSRQNLKDAKTSEVLLYESQPHSSLKEILVKSLGVKAVVDKTRKIYFIKNVKFHLDRVNNLGTFVEVESIDFDGTVGLETLKQQCQYYKELLEVKDEDIIAESYSDMIMNQANNH